MADTLNDRTPGGGGVQSEGVSPIAVDGAARPYETDRADRVAAALASWWGGHARDLPWRFGRTTPWGVLVSEVMSQQTPMSRVVPYWTAWMHDWPDPASFAAATTAEIITAWGHLGYPRRALRLRECAGVVCRRHDGRLPDSYEALVALPGIGDYTASAVMSFAFGRRIVVMDTNIRRVLSRVFVGEESIGGAASRRERGLAAEVLPRDDARSVVWNQSMMELGAIVCTARTPDCAHCPLAPFCVFLAEGRPGLGQRRTRPRQRFEGTDRQVRGLVLRALRNAGQGVSLSRADLDRLWKDRVQLDSCVASLDEDGLVEILPEGSVRLPLA